MRTRPILLAPFLALAAIAPALADAATPAACPAQPTRVTLSNGKANDYNGTVPGIPFLCRMTRADGPGTYYFGLWNADWPGAGQAIPALSATINGARGTAASFVTRIVPGLQFIDAFVNEGIEPLQVAGTTYQTLRLAHERTGIEGNTYHSIITSWRDIATGITLKVNENQIAGQSYGPDTTWTATSVEPIR